MSCLPVQFLPPPHARQAEAGSIAHISLHIAGALPAASPHEVNSHAPAPRASTRFGSCADSAGPACHAPAPFSAGSGATKPSASSSARLMPGETAASRPQDPAPRNNIATMADLSPDAEDLRSKGAPLLELPCSFICTAEFEQKHLACALQPLSLGHLSSPLTPPKRQIAQEGTPSPPPPPPPTPTPTAATATPEAAPPA